MTNAGPTDPNLRGEAGDRQRTGARRMNHVVGLGSSCAVYILERA
jgi:hypothetical protein